MAQQMITLEEAAGKLGLTPEEMKKRLKTDPEFKRLSQIRDGATVRFKLSAIEELARELGMSSEDNLPLAPMAPEEEPGSSDFKVGGAEEKPKTKKPADEVPLDFESGSSEEDVFSLADDPKPASPKSSAKLTPNKPATEKSLSDSSASGTDSDVRLDGGKSKKSKGDEGGVPTEEIALDFSGPGSAVIKGGSSAKLSAPKTGGTGKLSAPDSGKMKPAAGDSGKAKKSDANRTADPKKSDANVKDPKKSSSNKLADLARGAPPADSSEFELSLDADSDDFELQMSGDSSGGDEVDLGSLPKGVARGSKSGINLRDPADSGISLEKGKGKDTTGKDSGSKKETTKKDGNPRGAMSDSSSDVTAEPSSDVDFELSLDSSAAASTSKLGAPKSGKLVLDSESDSEFELTLDDSSSSSLEQAALGADALEESADKGDIFETDFEIPPMPDDSGSEAVAVDSDSDLEKSDFELAMDESDVASEEQSGSEVVLLDEEEGDAKPKTKGKAKPKKLAEETADVDVDLEDVGVEAEDEESAAGALKGVRGKKRGVDEDEEEEEVPVGAVVERPTKPWGPVPAILLSLTMPVVLLGALMGYELLQTMWGYQQPRKPAAPIIRGLASSLDMPLNDQ
jgi:hypothetical protein